MKLKINQFSKRIKINFKNEAQNWHKNKNNVVIKRWIVKNNNFYKSQRKKIRNQNTDDQIRKHSTINLD